MIKRFRRRPKSSEPELSESAAFQALRELLLEQRPEIVHWDPSHAGKVQQAMLELLRELQAEGTTIGRILSEEGFWRQWGGGLPAPTREWTDEGPLLQISRQDKEDGLRLGDKPHQPGPFYPQGYDRVDKDGD